MKVSTRGRYALRVLIDLAEHNNGSYIPMKDVAARQELSLKYLERIVPTLTKAKLIAGVHGKGGGYRLTRPPEEYPVGEVLRLTEGTLAPVACLAEDAEKCPRCDGCRTLPMWRDYNELTEKYFSGVTVADLLGDERFPQKDGAEAEA